MLVPSYATKEEPGNNWIKTGAHVMIVGSGAKMLDGYPRDAKATQQSPSHVACYGSVLLVPPSPRACT